MRVALVHYHLQTGGVSRVLRMACESLRGRSVDLAILSGAPPTTPWPVPVEVVPGLAYDEREPAGTPAGLMHELEAAAKRALRGAPDLWHFHNHSLGKNLVLPVALRGLAEQGYRLLLQIHDFPEDGRPANYARLLAGAGGDPLRLYARLYPVSGQIHYATLNRRDRDTLAAAGIPSPRLHLLPNPVWLESQPRARGIPQESEPLWLYPTRAIRRKNLGELLLWSAVHRGERRFATTRGPENPLERPAYDRWRAFAAAQRLPVAFGMGEEPGADFPSLLASAEALVTTSVAEGFGLAFLEPWLTGRPVLGRNIPEITDEFAEAGLSLDGLYSRLGIPAQWLDGTELRRVVAGALERLASAYGRPTPRDATDRALAAWTQDGLLDFGRLDEERQGRVIERVAQSREDRAELSPSRLDLPLEAGDWVTHNRRLVSERYSLAGNGERLLALYARVAASEPSTLDAADGAVVLDRFLAPERLYLLRS